MGIQSSINQTLATAGVAATAIKHIQNEQDSKEKQEVNKLEQEDKLQRELVDVDRDELKLQNDELKNKWDSRDLSSKMKEEQNLYRNGKMDEQAYKQSRQEALRQQKLLKQQRLDFELRRQSLTESKTNIEQRLDIIGGKK